MICYKDRWWCTHYEDCEKAEDCTRPLTPEVIENAKRWWGNNGYPPIEFSPINKPKCWEAKPEE